MNQSSQIDGFIKAGGLTFIRGFVMGVADLVPGFSGGTAALLLGIYQKLVDVLSAIGKFLTGKAKFKDIDFGFALPLGAGILAAVFGLAGAVRFFLEDFPEETAGVFLGLVAAGGFALSRSLISSLGHEVKSPVPAPAEAAGSWLKVYFWRTARFGLTAAVVAVLTFWGLGYQLNAVSNPGALVFLGSGVLASVALILPGISGSFVLLVVGMYGAYINVLTEFEIANLVFIVIGVLAGLLAFSSFLKFLLARFRQHVTAVMLGLLAGSTRVLWPWPNGVGIINRDSDEVINGATLDLPGSWGEFWLPATLAAAVATAAVALYRLRPLNT